MRRTNPPSYVTEEEEVIVSSVRTAVILPFVRRWRRPRPQACIVCQKRPKTVFIDGKTCYNVSGIMCANCHNVLGDGRYQKYDAVSLVLLEES